MSDSSNVPRRILVVDDEELILFAVTEWLRTTGFVADSAKTCAAARARIAQAGYDCVLMDMVLPDGSGQDLLKHIRQSGSTVPVVVMTAYGSLEMAVEAMKAGADDFIQKPFDMTHLTLTLQRVEQMCRCRLENVRLQVENARERERQELEQRKVRFFRFASHELKAPLVAVESSLRLMLEIHGGRLEAPVRDLLDRSLRRSDQLMQMINDMLAISADESSHKASYACTDVVAIAREVLALQEDPARRQRLKLSLDLEHPTAVARCHRPGIEKALANLLSNAVRYTPEGGAVELRVSSEGDSVVVSVRDTGIGIAAEDREHVFDEFFRAPNARKHAAIGTGLGLALVKKVVAEHGGSVSVSSRPGAGAIFTIRIPIGDCRPPA
jgi:signal transduction histidine kinase